jgi:hypothetical protein
MLRIKSRETKYYSRQILWQKYFINYNISPSWWKSPRPVFFQLFFNTNHLGIKKSKTWFSLKYLLPNLHMYLHTYVSTYVHMYLHTYVSTYVHMYLHTYVSTYVHMYLHTYVELSSILSWRKSSFSHFFLAWAFSCHLFTVLM